MKPEVEHGGTPGTADERTAARGVGDSPEITVSTVARDRGLGAYLPLLLLYVLKLDRGEV